MRHLYDRVRARFASLGGVEVADWILRQPSDELFTAAVCQAEILSGLAAVPIGRRRAEFEEAAAGCAEAFAARRKAGRPGGTIDLMVAAIARVRGASVVTRNLAGFEGVGVAIVNPWDESDHLDSSESQDPA